MKLPEVHLGKVNVELKIVWRTSTIDLHMKDMKQSHVGHAIAQGIMLIFSKTVNVDIIFSVSFEHFLCENQRNVTISFQF